MTSKLLILGNGFDLHCGLQSSYKEFFTKEILDRTNENFGIIRIKRDVAGFWEGLLFEYYKKYKNTDYPWYVVENIIKDTLWQICFGKEDSSANIDSGLWKKGLVLAQNSRQAGFWFANTPDPIENYIIEFCSIFFYNNLAASQGSSDIEQLRPLIKRLLGELNDFERRFCRYLKKNILNAHDGNGLNVEYLANAFNLLAEITNFSKAEFDVADITSLFDGRHRTLGIKNRLLERLTNLKDTYILSFNYTALFDILLIENPCAYINVHGKLCNKLCAENCEASNIIFGIDDKLIEPQMESINLRLFSKTYRKMFTTSCSTDVLPSCDKPVDIIFYGHSLSEADYSYFQSIFDYYNLYNNSKAKLCFGYSEPFNPTDAVYRLINEYGKTLANKDQGKNLTHKLLLENRINIKRIG